MDKTGLVRFANPATEALFGRAQAELVDELFGFPVVANERVELDIISKQGLMAVAEMRVVEVEWEGEKVYLASLRDISERKQVEEQLRFQAQLLDSVRESIVATDMEGRVIYWGNGAKRLYGYSADEVMGRHISFIVEPQAAEEEEQRVRQVIETGSWVG